MAIRSAAAAGYCLRTGVPGFCGVRFWAPKSADGWVLTVPQVPCTPKRRLEYDFGYEGLPERHLEYDELFSSAVGSVLPARDVTGSILPKILLNSLTFLFRLFSVL